MVKAMKYVSSPLLFRAAPPLLCYFWPRTFLFLFLFFPKMLLSTRYVLASVQVFFPEVLLLNPLIW